MQFHEEANAAKTEASAASIATAKTAKAVKIARAAAGGERTVIIAKAKFAATADAEPLLSPEIPPDFLSLFRDMSYAYTGRGYHDKLIRYRLFVPVIKSPGEKLPLVVWLHGFGEAGSDNSQQLLHLDLCLFHKPWTADRFPFFFLAIQCPAGNRSWTTSSPNADDMVNVVLPIMDKTLADFPIDKDRVLLAGISSGGDGCWELAMRAPDRFAAAAPMAAGAPDATRAMRLKKLPTWAFHCTDDRSTPILADRQMVARLQELGCRAYLTELPAARHDCWDAAFEDYDLLNWLLAQRRGVVSNYAPGTIPLSSRMRHMRDDVAAWASSLHPWQIAVQLGIPLFVIAAVWSAIRHRRVRSRTRIAK
jgi:predicted peptidase